jgi:fermentation-respiration switch protein FrsA (DUF1100 family)
VKNFLVLALSALLIFAVATSWLLFYPAVPKDLAGAPDLDLQAKPVRIAVSDGDSLDAYLLAGTRPGVIVLFHGYARNHSRQWRYAQFLRHDGWTLLAPDFRSSRSTNRKPTTLGFHELQDGEAVLRWIAEHPELGGQPLGLFGESLGGSVAIALASAHSEVSAVVADCPFANGRQAIDEGCTLVGRLPAVPFGALTRAIGHAVTGHDPAALDVVAAVRKYGDRPLFLIQAGVEDRFTVAQTTPLNHAAGAKTELWRPADSGHNAAWIMHRKEYEHRVRSFFREFLHGPHGAAAER